MRSSPPSSKKNHTFTAQLQSKLSSSKRIEIIHVARQRSSLPSCNRISQHGCGAVCRVLNNLNYSSSIALESNLPGSHPSSSKQIKLISTARLRSSPPSYKQIKHISQHGCRADCKVLDKSNVFWQHQVLNKSNLFPQHGCRADCQLLNISNGGACHVIYISNLFWKHSCRTVVKF